MNTMVETPVKTVKPVAPWVRADALTRCFLYWTPYDFTRASSKTTAWLTRFFSEFEKAIAKEHKLEGQYFLQMKSLEDRTHYLFVKNAPELMPIAGMGIVPGVPVTPPFSMESAGPLLRSEKTFQFQDYVADYVYWMLNGDLPVCREFWPSGGMSMMFVPPVPNSLPPQFKIPAVARKMVPAMDPDRFLKQALGLMNPFHRKSKELFGKPYEKELGYEGWVFFVPLLSSSHFFSLPADEIGKVLELSPVYVNESVADRGILVASKTDLSEILNEITRQVEAEGIWYPGLEPKS